MQSEGSSPKASIRLVIGLSVQKDSFPSRDSRLGSRKQQRHVGRKCLLREEDIGWQNQELRLGLHGKGDNTSRCQGDATSRRIHEEGNNTSRC